MLANGWAILQLIIAVELASEKTTGTLLLYQRFGRGTINVVDEQRAECDQRFLPEYAWSDILYDE